MVKILLLDVCWIIITYIKNHYRLIAVNLNRQKELDTDPKAIQQTEFVEQYKKLDNNGIVLEIYLDHKCQWPQEGLNCKSLAYTVVTYPTRP